MRVTKATDHSLLIHWRHHGDPAAFAALVDRHAAMVHSASMRIVRNRALAQEVAQDSFLKLSQLERFDGESLGGWLHRVATNRALDILKAESRRHTREAAFEESREAVAPSSEVAAVLGEIDAAIASLPVELRDLVVLHYLEGRSHREIARRLGASRLTVARDLRLALDQLREHLGARGIAGGAAVTLAALESARAATSPVGLVETLRKLALNAPVRPAATPAAGSSVPVLAIAAIAVLIAIGAVLVPKLRTTPPAPTVSGPPASAAVSTPPPAPPAAPQAEPPQPIQVAQAQPAPTPTTAEPPSGLVENVVLKCVDGDGKPVADAEIYLIRDAVKAKPATIGSHPGDTPSVVYGPMQSDRNGEVALPPLDGQDVNGKVTYNAYGHVLGKLVGVWNRIAGNKKQDGWDTMIFIPSKILEGTVTVPRGYDVTKVLVYPTLIFTRPSNKPYGSFFGRPSDRPTFPFSPLAGQHPDSQGRFHLDGFPAVGSMAFAASGEGLAEVRIQIGDQDLTKTAQIEMMHESIIYGAVRYKPTGAPVPNVTVYARASGLINNSGNTVPLSAQTDNLGRYRITGVYEEKYRVLAFPIGNPPEWAAPVLANIDVGKSAEIGPVDLWFDRGGWVEGVVREKKSRKPVDGVGINAVNPDTVDGINPGETFDSAITAAGDRYRVFLPAGQSMLYFSMMPDGYPYPKGQERKTITIDPNQRTPLQADFEIEGPTPAKPSGFAVFTGRVKDGAGKPIKDVPIYDNTKDSPEEKWSMHQFLGRTGADGSFRFSVDPTGSHQIEFGGGNGSPMPPTGFRFSTVLKGEIHPEPNKTYDVGEAVVEEYTRSIGGRVLDESGAPLAHAELYLEASFPISGFPGVRGISDDHGAFTLQYLPAGKFSLRAYLKGYKETTVDAEPGFNYDLTLNVAPPSRD